MMKNISKYVVLFFGVALFLYFYDMFMPKSVLYFVVGIPALYISTVLIMKTLKLQKIQKINPELK
ncbi:hypothetical protein BL05183 [Bacillus licheniformis DSM 13 = ATCC 14580]|uniref:Uncharacterized protein n=2 Tax=Bacillus licheniformis TaxID=1402 RepID=Q62UP1_BACLD|nr:hypothetical protein BL05183 [Bacillus licheniformis DSM 13 = ATCC 14580]AKQ73142.1 hypothetical protein MUY_002010 [Bacillus licheniformis WX-02]KUL12960.1 hypothetical protein LI17339_02775 [Bacillus licheniformis LMG 17339]